MYGYESVSAMRQSKTLSTLASYAVAPFAHLTRFIYYNGPATLGMWQGIGEPEMCAKLTRVPSDVWQKQSEACSSLLDRDFVAFGIGAGLCVSGLLAWKLLDLCILRMMLAPSKIIIQKHD
jgi:hypothetical protein